MMGARRTSRAMWFAAVGIMLLAGCGRDHGIAPPVSATDGGPDGGPPETDAYVGFPDTGLSLTELILQRAVPDHGPFTGGSTVVLRGTGFTDTADVTVGGRAVQPADHRLIDSRRLSVIVPAGEVGPADVTVKVGDEEVTLPDGYTYDAFYLTPDRGSVSGGTLLEITGSGTTFEADDEVTLGRTPCQDVTVVSETRITCRTPPMAAGSVDVTITRPADASELTVEDGYTYYDSTDPFSGGLGGGPLDGSLNVTAIDGATGLPVADAFTMVGEDLSTEHQGLTDLMGQITFSGPDILAPVTVHVAKHCYEKTSVVSFDARDVTVFLVPWMDPICGMGPPGGGGRGRNGTTIGGELIWLGPNEYGPNPWNNIPSPRDNEVKVAYVYTTQSSVEFPNPDPAGGGGQRVLERLPDDLMPHLGYPYRIFARPAGLAVYALAGLENTVTGEFLPYIMGIARNVLGGPGEEVTGADMVMNIPLDHTVDVAVEDVPMRARTGPDRFKVEAYIDLGGEGIIVRNVNGEEFDIVRARTSDNPFRFWAQPALFGALSDGRYQMVAGWYTGDFDAEPSTVAIQRGIRAVDETVTIGGFVGIPQATSPAYGARLPDDRILRWEADGSEPDLHVVLMVGGDGNPAWRHFAPGNVNEAPIPDLSTIPEIDDITSGFITWVVYAIKIPGFDFDEFSYSFLSDRYWSHYAYDVHTATR